MSLGKQTSSKETKSKRHQRAVCRTSRPHRGRCSRASKMMAGSPTSRLASISNVSALGQPVGIQYSKHLETSCIETETIHHIYHIHHHHPPPAACSHRRPPPPPRHGRCRPPRQRRRPCSCNRRGRSCQRYRRLPLRLRRRHSRQFSMFVVIASNSEVVIVIIIIIFTPLSWIFTVLHWGTLPKFIGKSDGSFKTTTLPVTWHWCMVQKGVEVPVPKSL